MVQQATDGNGTGEADLTEEVQTQPDTRNEAGTQTPAQSAPALNRAERRAQAKGKKNGAAAPSPTSSAGHQHGPNARTAGHAGQVRFPRTGHK